MDLSSGTERLQVLHKIDSELDSKNVAALKFLCRDLVPEKHLERVRDGMDLFMRLEDQGLLEDGLLVGELLHTIQRKDLLRFLRSNSAAMEQSLRNNFRISPYRKMLYSLSEDVTEDTLRSIKFLLKLPRAKLEANASFLDVLVAMEKQEMLKVDSLEELRQAMDKCDKRLAMTVQEFAEQRAAGGHNLSRVSSQESSLHSYLSLPEDDRQQPPSSIQQTPSVPEPSPSNTPSGSPVDSQLSMDTGTESRCQEVYDIKHRPRGHCVIISNHSFQEAFQKHPELRLGDREGTHVDERALEEVFSSLHFTVHHRRDLSRAGLLRVAEEFGSRSHAQLDAFVCCVLSHGKRGSVYGTDGEAASIRQLTQPFSGSRCPSLAGKPKLFFIQACQALPEEGAVRADGPKDRDDDIRADASAAGPDTVPDDSDFLLGMATVEYQKSYRHTHRGSAYIQELCRQLRRGCSRKEDILAIMTRVNRLVSDVSLGGFRQMPQPRYTLTKKLILPMD